MLLVLASLAAAVWAQCPSSQCQCSGTPNNLPIWNGAPTLVSTVANGSHYVAEAQVGNSLNVVHLYGTPYQMGYAHGQMFKNEIPIMLVEFMAYLESQIAQFFQNLTHSLPQPPEVQKVAEELGIEAALELTAELTAPYTPAHFFEELHGIADALEGSVSYQRLLNFNMFPEVIKASCTMFGAWGPAITNCSDLSLTQLRALDFGTDSPLVNYSALIVYHPEQDNGHAFANLGWVGFVGSVTAYSGWIGVSEKVWDAYKGKKSSIGYPFHFLLRDIAQYDMTVDDSFNRIYNASRTCSIWIGLGSNYTDQFRVVAYSLQQVSIYDDLNFPTWSVHPYLKGTVYIDKHVQPSYDPCLGSLMQYYYGDFTAANTIANIVGPFQTGDLHAAVYTFGNNNMYVSVAGPLILPNGQAVNGTVVGAYQRPWFQFDMTTMFLQTL